MRAFRHEAPCRFHTDAGTGSDDNDDLPGEFLFGGHPFQFSFFEQPVFDIERLLLRQRDIFVNRLRAAHDFDGAVVKFRRDARLGFVLAPRNHAKAWNQDDGRIRVAHCR